MKTLAFCWSLPAPDRLPAAAIVRRSRCHGIHKKLGVGLRDYPLKLILRAGRAPVCHHRRLRHRITLRGVVPLRIGGRPGGPPRPLAPSLRRRTTRLPSRPRPDFGDQGRPTSLGRRLTNMAHFLTAGNRRRGRPLLPPSSPARACSFTASTIPLGYLRNPNRPRADGQASTPRRAPWRATRKWLNRQAGPCRPSSRRRSIPGRDRSPSC